MHLAALILSVAAVVLATVSQGTVNLSRDFLIAVSPLVRRLGRLPSRRSGRVEPGRAPLVVKQTVSQPERASATR